MAINKYNKPIETKIADTIKYLNRAFAKAAFKASNRIGMRANRFRANDNTIRTSKMYDYQVDFCYIIDNIQRGPKYIAPKLIQKANEMIDELEHEG